MSVDVKAETVVARPRADVAKLMFDPKSDTLWIEGLRQVFPQTPGALAKGSKLERRGTMGGVEFVSNLEVTRDEPGTMLEFSSPEPFEMKIRYELKDADGGTSVMVRVQSVGDIGRIAMPPAVLANKVKQGLEGDLKKLKKYLESEG